MKDIFLLIIGMVSFLSCDSASKFLYRGEYQRLQKTITELQVKLMEVQAVADNLPLFDQEVRKACRLDDAGVQKIKDEFQKRVDHTLNAAKFDLPYEVQKIPEPFRRKDLEDQYVTLLKKIDTLTPVIFKVEALKEARRDCLAKKTPQHKRN